MVRSIGVNIAARAAPSTPSAGFRETRQSAPRPNGPRRYTFSLRFAYLEGGYSGRSLGVRRRNDTLSTSRLAVYTLPYVECSPR